MLEGVANPRGIPDALGLVGTTVDQVRFDLCVDSGGFGLIYRGKHLGLDEDVAIKTLRIAGMRRPDEKVREAIAGRFRDETRILYRLSQGNLDIVRCIGSGTVVAPATGDLTPYMVLEWLDGFTLSAELKDRRARKLPNRTLEEAVDLLGRAAAGLAYAHAQDVVHRDIKPGNLFLASTREGVRVKVLDFGLAKILSDATIGFQQVRETAAGVHFCSPSYGAPEQFASHVGPIGPPADVYSLALVLLEVMTGEKVRPATNLADGLVKALNPATGSPTPSSLGLVLPPAVEEVLVRAVAQQPEDRPRDAGAFWSELEAAMRASRTAVAAPLEPLQKTVAALGATVVDQSVGDAMQEVRARLASQRPPPFAGTMVMQTAPSGAPHLAQAAAAAEGATAAAPPVPRTTAPLRPPQPQPQPLSQPPPLQPRPTPQPMAMTVPIGVTSPLASTSPLAAPAAPPRTPVPPSPPVRASEPPRSVVSAPPPPPMTEAGGRAGMILIAVALVMIAVLGIAMFVLYSRGD